MARLQGYRASSTEAVKNKILEAVRVIVKEKLQKESDGPRSQTTEGLVVRELYISEKTWQHFLEARQNIDRETFKRICDWLGLRWQEIVDTCQGVVESDEPFFGRAQELAQLETWIKNPYCRMITVHGFEGMGKCSLVRALKKRVHRDFHRFEWVPFSYGEPVDDTLKYLLRQLEPKISFTDLSLEQVKRELRDRLTTQRYAIVLQQQPNGQTSRYEEYSNWLSELLRCHSTNHRSCILLITSYERHDGLTDVANNSESVKRLHLKGVDDNTGLAIFKKQEPSLAIDSESAAKLVKLFEGYPSALRAVSSHIKNNYDGNLQHFLEDPSIPKEIEKVIRGLIETSGQSALTILKILTEYTEAIPQSDLRSIYKEQIGDVKDFTTAISTLLRRSLIVRYEGDAVHGTTYFYGLADSVTRNVIRTHLLNRV